LDNSLFKIIKDFAPARTSLATGIVIKQSILERNKYPVPQVSLDSSSYSSSITMYTVTGSHGGVMPEFYGGISSSNNYFGSINITQ
ncbi:MAG: hypothetical protein KC414_06565, partial [Romboutsia sp.]|nr:hypothetical protein [Romboutsia sp.]